MSVIPSPSTLRVKNRRQSHRRLGKLPRRRYFSATLACGLLFPASTLSAPHEETGSNEEKIEFSGSEECNEKGLLLAEIDERLVGFSSGATEYEGTRVLVGVESTGRGLTAKIEVLRAGKAPITRTLSAASCEEVLEGSALVVAVAVSEELNAKKLSKATDEAVKPSAVERATPSGVASTTRIGGGVAGFSLFGVAPNPMFGGGLFFDWSRRGGMVSPLVRLEVLHGEARGVRLGSGVSEFRLDSASLELCPLAFFGGSSFYLRPCLGASLGFLAAHGLTYSSNLSASHPRVAFSGGVRAEREFGSAFALELAASAEIPLISGRFFVDDVVFFRSAPVGMRVGFGVTAKF